jgi:hypothetical protein
MLLFSEWISSIGACEPMLSCTFCSTNPFCSCAFVGRVCRADDRRSSQPEIVPRRLKKNSQIQLKTVFKKQSQTAENSFIS